MLDFIIFALLNFFSHFEIKNGSWHSLNHHLALVHLPVELSLPLHLIVDVRPPLIREPLLLEEESDGLLADGDGCARVSGLASLARLRLMRRHSYLE